jgi:hypothetical protein
VLSTSLLVLPALLTFLCAIVLLGAWRDDAAISGHRGRATAEVVSASFIRTIVRFGTPDGAVHSPTTGVLYPGGLRRGQLVRVEYDVRDPDLVRVAGRGAGLGLVPALVTVACAWVLCVPPSWWLRQP